MSHVVTTVRTHTGAHLEKARRRLFRGAITEPAATERPYPSLSAPLVTLYVSPSHRRESNDAFTILTEARTGFRVALASDGSVAAEFAGAMQYGIEGVRRLRDALLRFGKDVTRAGAGLDPLIAQMQKVGVREQAEEELACQLEAARDDLHRLLG